MSAGDNPTTADNLASRLVRDSDRPALILPDRTWSHTDLAERVARWRGGLTEVGIGPGDRVATMFGNTAEFVSAHLAAMGVGAITVPLNPDAPKAELAGEIAAVEPSVLIGDPGGPIEASTLGVGRVVTPAMLDVAVPVAVTPVRPEAPAALLFTSGTAGAPKPAILTHRNLTAGLQAVLSVPTGLGGNDVFLCQIPLFHVFGLNTVLHLALVVGASVVLEDFDRPARTGQLAAEHGVTILAGPPTLWRALVRDPDTARETFGAVRLAVSGASKLPAQLRVDVADRLGLDLQEGYGLTETSAVVTSTLAVDAPLGSVGALLPGVEARIVDVSGEECLVGDPGELWVKGPMVSPGYWPEAKDSTDAEDGWLRTGDVVVADEDGFLAIVDRSKDLIIVSGFNVFPAEVEGVLAAHPDVASAGVVGEYSEDTGEAVVAFVVPEPGVDPDEDELRRHCRSSLARYKNPTRYVIADELPIGPTGKLRRARLSD